MKKERERMCVLKLNVRERERERSSEVWSAKYLRFTLKIFKIRK